MKTVSVLGFGATYISFDSNNNIQDIHERRVGAALCFDNTWIFLHYIIDCI